VDFIEILKDIMSDFNLNQTQLANKLGLKQSQISEWLNGKSKSGYDSLKLLCQTLGISADSLLGLE
jgi:transcriptional regulator with XRE-family HTH domain